MNEPGLLLLENRHPVSYEVRWVALTLIVILKMSWEDVPRNGIRGLQMNFSLRGDFDTDGNPPPPACVPSLVVVGESGQSRRNGDVEDVGNQAIMRVLVKMI